MYCIYFCRWCAKDCILHYRATFYFILIWSFFRRNFQCQIRRKKNSFWLIIWSHRSNYPNYVIQLIEKTFHSYQHYNVRFVFVYLFVGVVDCCCCRRCWCSCCCQWFCWRCFYSWFHIARSSTIFNIIFTCFPKTIFTF